LVICAVANLFGNDRKAAKARKWFERAVVLDPDWGDSWGWYYAFELGMERELSAVVSSNVDVASKEEEEVKVPAKKSEAVKERCIKADPKHGEIWCRIMKTMERRLTVGEGLERVATEMMDKSSN